MEEMGRGSIPLGHSGYKVQPVVSQGSISEMSIGIKYNKEVLMEAGRSNQVTKKTLSMKTRVTLKVRVIVALVAVCLLAAPSTRAHKHDSEQVAEPDGAIRGSFTGGRRR
jgi:hypothetical protein